MTGLAITFWQVFSGQDLLGKAILVNISLQCLVVWGRRMRNGGGSHWLVGMKVGERKHSQQSGIQ